MWFWENNPGARPPAGMFFFMAPGWEMVVGCQDRWDAAMEAARTYSTEKMRAVESPIDMVMLGADGPAVTIHVEYLGHGKPKPVVLP